MVESGVGELKILCFSGREHHYKRLSPVVNELRSRGHDVKYIISDNGVHNMHLATDYLVPAGEQYVHAMQFFTSPMMLAVNEITKVTLQRIYAQNGTVDWVDPFWMTGAVREMSELLLAFTNMLQAYKPDAVMILHEANFFCKLLAYLCKQAHVPCISFQEGLLRHRDQSTQGKFNLASEYSHLILMWSEKAKQAYVEAGVTEDRLMVTGIPHLDSHLLRKADKEFQQKKAEGKYLLGFRPDQKLVVFAPPQLARYEGNVDRALSQLAEWSMDTMTQMAMCFHPFEANETFQSIQTAFQNHPYTKLVMPNVADTIDVIALADVVISQHSTVAIETLALGIPFVELDLDQVGVLESLVDQEVATRVGPNEFKKIDAILQGNGLPNYVLVNEWVINNVGPRDGQASKRAANEIERAIA